jgi:tRNA modification GTPase
LSTLTPRRSAVATARRGGIPVDRVVAVFWEAADGPLGEDLLEITCHGSPEILRDIVAAATDAGARLAEPGEFTRRAFTAGRLDLSQAEAVENLISARGYRARKAALERLDGALTRAVAGCRGPILDVLARLEARLDHPDEDIAPWTPAEAERLISDLKPPLERLRAAYLRGRGERDGLRVCLVGRPNVGKSSLLNALLGRDRAIVSPVAGTTRDTVEEDAVLEGVSARLIDTAGMRGGAVDLVEREGVARAEKALSSCDVAVLVVDAARSADADDRDVEARVRALAARESRPVVVAFNKIDLRSAPLDAGGGFAVSAASGRGLEELTRAVVAAAESSNLDEGESLLVGERDEAALSAALGELEQGRHTVATHPGAWEDRAALHLRAAFTELGRILGEGAPDEVLHAVFSRFCVGK